MGILKWLLPRNEERQMAGELRRKRKVANDEIRSIIEKWILSDELYEKIQQLIAAGVNVNIEDDKGRTLLDLAAHYNCPRIASLLIHNKVVIDHICNYRSQGMTPLMQAAIFGHAEVVRILVDAGADMSKIMTFPNDSFIVDVRGNHVTALDLAKRNNHPKVIAILEEYKQSSSKKAGIGTDISQSLITASKENDAESVQSLLNENVDVNEVDSCGRTALWWAASKGNTNILRMLIEANGAVDLKHDDGQTALWMAAAKGHLECVKALLEAGANVNAKVGRVGISVLKIAEKHEIITALLKEFGATN